VRSAVWIAGSIAVIAVVFFTGRSPSHKTAMTKPAPLFSRQRRYPTHDAASTVAPTCGHQRLLAESRGVFLLLSKDGCRIRAVVPMHLLPNNPESWAPMGNRLVVVTSDDRLVWLDAAARVHTYRRLPPLTSYLAADTAGLWRTSPRGAVRLNPDGTAVGTVALSGDQQPANAFLDDGTGLWIRSQLELVRIDNATLARRAIYLEDDSNQNGDSNAIGYGSFWISDLAGKTPRSAAAFSFATSLTGGSGTTYRFDKNLHLIDAIPTPYAAGVNTGAGYVWVLSLTTGILYQIQPATDHIRAALAVGRDAPGAANQMWSTVANGIDWIVQPGYNDLLAINPKTLTVTRTIRIPYTKSGCVTDFTAADGKELWLAYPPGCG
jgi:hypothetical protein